MLAVCRRADAAAPLSRAPRSAPLSPRSRPDLAPISHRSGPAGKFESEEAGTSLGGFLDGLRAEFGERGTARGRWREVGGAFERAGRLGEALVAYQARPW